VSEQRTTRVADVMTREVVAIHPDADAYDALRLMSTRNLGRLIVMKDGQMQGIVSRTDIVRAIQFKGISQ
jgi:predicted transcriptional regulator